MAEPTEAFAELVARPEAAIRLDEAALWISAHASPGLEIGRSLAELDELAAGVPDPVDAPALVRHLYEDLGFRGDDVDYGHPRNSFLDQVLERRRGIPITLAVVVIEAGRRCGLVLDPVGMPGHFLVGLGGSRYLDPFTGRQLDEPGARRLLAGIHPGLRWVPAFLQPIGPRAVLARVLANLRVTYARRRDLASLLWVLRLRLAIPDHATDEDRRQLHQLVARSN